MVELIKGVLIYLQAVKDRLPAEPPVEPLLTLLRDELERLEAPQVCDFCQGVGQIRASGMNAGDCPWCGGTGFWKDKPKPPSVLIEVWRTEDGYPRGCITVSESPEIAKSGKLLDVLRHALEMVEKGMEVGPATSVQ